MKNKFLLIICNLALVNTGFAQWQPANNGLTGKWINVLTVDPTTNNIYAGTDKGVYLSTDDGRTWVRKNEDFLVKDFEVSTIATSGNNIFAGTGGAGIFLSTNNGSTWTPVNNGLSGKDIRVTEIAISENNIFIGIINSGVWKRKLSESIIGIN